MNTFFRIIFLLLGTIVIAQKGSVSGIIAFKDGSPADLASVYIENSLSHAYTNESGYYELSNITYGTHDISIKFYGRKPEVRTITVSENSNTLDHKFKYNEYNKLSEVVVKGLSKESKIENKGFAVNAIKMEEVALQSLQATEVLDRSSGVRIRQNGGLGSHTHFSINGLTGNAIRVFINGTPIAAYGPSFSLSSIPATMIERIEVYKGVVPVHLAGDALGGAINVILNEDFNEDNLEASYSFGSFNTHQFSISGNHYNKKSGFTFLGSSFHNYSDNNYKVHGNQVYTTATDTRDFSNLGNIKYVKAERFHDTYASRGINLSTGVSNRKWADKLLFGAIFSSLELDIQHGATMETVYGNRKRTQRTKLASLSYNDNSFFSNENLKFDAYTSYSKLKRRVIDTISDIYDWDGERQKQYDISTGEFLGYYQHASTGEAGDATLAENIQKVCIAKTNTEYTIADTHTITFNFLYNKFNRETFDPLEHLALFDYDETRFSNRNILGLGYSFNALNKKLKGSVFYKYFNQKLRVLEYDYDGGTDTVSVIFDIDRNVKADGFGFTFSYKLFSNFLIQISGENSFRLPESEELFGDLSESLLPNYALEPEKSKNLNVGFTLGTFNFGKNETRLRFNGFIRDTKDKIKINTRLDPQDETTEYVNDGDFISKGFDLDFFYSYDRKLDFNANVSVFNSRFNIEFDDNGLPYTWYDDRERNAPFFTGNANLSYKINDVLQKGSSTNFVTNLSYVHWFYRDWESLGGKGKDVIPTQLISDFGITHTFPNKKITLALDAKNLFNDQVFDNYALQKPGRAFYMKINYKFY